MITIQTKLSVKELAAVLGRSVYYVYKARRAGLPMEWDPQSKCFVQTKAKTVSWVRKTGFCVVRGSIRVQKGCKS